MTNVIKICRPNYLDASALVKLVADDADEEPGRQVLRDYYWSHTANVYATSFSVSEALTAFKNKFVREKIKESDYLRYAREFLRLTIGANLRIDNLPILSPVIIEDAERMVPIYRIDFLDCIQITTIKHGYFRNFESLLITADRKLAKAARAEGIDVWECTSEPAPNDELPYMLESATAGL